MKKQTSNTKQISKLYAICCLLIITFVISGCSLGTSGKLFITKSPEKLPEVSSIDIVESESQISVPLSVKAYFDSNLKKNIYKEKYFKKGTDIIIEYKYIEVNPGSQFVRWFVGFGLGKGTIRVEAKFIDPSGNELSSIQAEGSIISGFFGGSFNYAIDRTIKEIVNFTKQNFK